MQLNEFTSLLVHDSKSALNFFNILLQYNFTTPNAQEKAILEYFNSLSEDIKKNTDFSKVFTLFFMRFKINENNINLYEQYITDKVIQQIVRKKNKDWHWKEKVELSYEEFLKTLRVLPGPKAEKKEAIQVVKNFLTDYEDKFIEFIHQDKKKMIKELSSTILLEEYLLYDYVDCKAFYKKYDLPLYELIEEKFFNGSLGIAHFFNSLFKLSDTDQHDLMQEAVISKQNIFAKFYKENALDSENAYSFLTVFLEQIIEGKKENAYLMMKYIEPFLQEDFQKLSNNKYKIEKHSLSENLYEIIYSSLYEIVYNLDILDLQRYENLRNKISDVNKIRDFVEYYNKNKSVEKLEKELEGKENKGRFKL